MAAMPIAMNLVGFREKIEGLRNAGLMVDPTMRRGGKSPL